MKYLSVFGAALLSLAMVAPAAAQYQPAPYGQTNYRAALSADDQQQFDHYYQKWVDSTRKNDRDDVIEAAQHMQEIMARNSIPSNVPFDAIAANAAYPQPYAPQTYAYPVYNGPRLSGDDQRKFDEEYAKWVNDTRKNDQDDIAKHASKMQEIMSRNGVPAGVPFAALATNGYAAAPVAATPAPYAYGYPAAAPVRLNSDDQKRFNKAYGKWLEARDKRKMGEMEEQEGTMRGIMARYNIPANVAFADIANH